MRRSGGAEWWSGVVERSGAAEWCGGMVQRSGAAEWCSGVVERSGAAEWCSGVVQRQYIFGSRPNTCFVEVWLKLTTMYVFECLFR